MTKFNRGQDVTNSEVTAMKARIVADRERLWDRAAQVQIINMPKPPAGRRKGLCLWCDRPAVAGCDDQCEHCYAENSLSASGGY